MATYTGDVAHACLAVVLCIVCLPFDDEMMFGGETMIHATALSYFLISFIHMSSGVMVHISGTAYLIQSITGSQNTERRHVVFANSHIAAEPWPRCRPITPAFGAFDRFSYHVC